jgi:hypothetical protein
LRSSARSPGFAGVWLAIALLAGGEIALRLHWFGFRAVLLPWRYTATRLFNTDLVVEDRDPGIGWRLRPGARSHYLGASFTTNQHGFRDREVTRETPAGVVRLAALGASITMGAGVGDAEVYPRRVQDRLDARWPGRFEVLNFGVGAYRGPQMARAYERDVAPFHPQVVLVPIYEREIGEAVADPPAALPADRLRWTNVRALLSRFFLYSALREGFAELGARRLSLDWPLRMRRTDVAAGRSVRAIEVLESFTAARTRQGVRVVLTVLPELSDTPPAMRARFALEMRRLAARHPGAEVVDCSSRLAAAIGPGDRVYYGDKHPSARIHDLYAEAIYSGMLPLLTALAERRGGEASR